MPNKTGPPCTSNSVLAYVGVQASFIVTVAYKKVSNRTPFKVIVEGTW
jgi:hypothetical protein